MLKRSRAVSSRVRKWCPAAPSVQTTTFARKASPSCRRHSSNVPAAVNS
jgi:hypothetical protein